MTISYRQTPGSQEPDPRQSSAQQAQHTGAPHGTQFVGSPHPLPASIRRKVVGKLPVAPPAGVAVDSQVFTSGSSNSNVAVPQEVEKGNIILYRRPNFFLRTVYHPGQKQYPLRKPTGNT